MALETAAADQGRCLSAVVGDSTVDAKDVSIDAVAVDEEPSSRVFLIDGHTAIEDDDDNNADADNAGDDATNDEGFEEDGRFLWLVATADSGFVKTDAVCGRIRFVNGG